MADQELTTTYRPGGWVALSTRDTWLLVDLSPDHVLVRTSWSLVSTGATVDAVLDLLAGGGIANTPDFALVHLTTAERRVVVRGEARAVLHLDKAGGPITVHAPRPTSWVDRLIDDTAKVIELISAQAEDHTGVQLPMSAGVTMAAAVRIDPDSSATAPAEHPEQARPMPSPPAPPPPPVQPQEPPPAAPGTPADADAAPSYDHLFGATQGPPEPDPSATAGWHTMYPPEPAVAGPELALPPADPGGLIDAVPSFSEPQPVAVPMQAETAADEISHTVDRSRLPRQPAESRAPTVLAGYCPAGHLSPPHAAVCRLCGAAMPNQPGFEIPRPALGVLRMSTGDMVTLDRGVVLGRAPQTDVTGEDRPHVVRLKSPENDISRNHAEIVLDGWHVYVKDLGSVNGTEVTLPGQRPIRLREHELQLLENGARVTLADEVTLTFEVTP